MTGTGELECTKTSHGGTLSASATTGSGMPVYFRGNYMTAARASYGVLSQDNINLGFSLGYGKTLDTMGYKLWDPEPQLMRLAGADLTILRNNLEHRFEFLGGQVARMRKPTRSFTGSASIWTRRHG